MFILIRGRKYRLRYEGTLRRVIDRRVYIDKQGRKEDSRAEGRGRVSIAPFSPQEGLTETGNSKKNYL